MHLNRLLCCVLAVENSDGKILQILSLTAVSRYGPSNDSLIYLGPLILFIDDFNEYGRYVTYSAKL